MVLATRLVTLAAAPVTLLLVMTRLVPAEQGVYFIFVNAFALSQLFEIGVGSLVVQYASHEIPHVSGARAARSRPTTPRSCESAGCFADCYVGTSWLP